jgi:hypothetical protein
VPRVPNTKEFAELAENMRVRIIRAEKTSYRKQFEEGMLDRVAVLALNSVADTVTDIPHKYVCTDYNISAMDYTLSILLG